MTITIPTQLGYLENTAEKLQLKNKPTYIFKLGCGCSVYNKVDVLSHTWAICEHQDAEFWCERYCEEGRTTKHPLKADEIEDIFGNVSIGRAELPDLLLRQKELHKECVWKNTDEYVTILRENDYININKKEMTLMEEKALSERIRGWFIKENLTPPEYELLHLLTVARLALDDVIASLESNETVSDVVLFGN